MRHIPTSLYIDTEVFKRNKLRLDTASLSRLQTTFVKGGLRLIVPQMMERELLRHYRNQAKKCWDAVSKAQLEHPIPSLGLWEPQSQDEVEDACFQELQVQWENFKSHFSIESLPLVGDMNRVADWYFKIEPPFTEKKPKEFPDAFILSALEKYHADYNANIAVVSRDVGFKNACTSRRYLQHFDDLKQYIDAFKPELTKEKYLTEEPVDPTRPIVTEDLTELKSILGRGDQVTPIEIERAIELLGTRGENFRYFFYNTDSPLWLPHLKAKGLFSNPPQVRQAEDGSFEIPDWPPIYYLERVFKKSLSHRGEILSILEELPTTTNPRVLEEIVEIVLQSDGSDLPRFSEQIMTFVDHSQWSHEKIIQLIDRLSL